VSTPNDCARGPLLRASPEHARELAELHARLFAQSWDEASFQRLLEDRACATFLARAGNPAQTAGLILGRVAADEAEILTLGVCPWHRRHGIARRLVEAFARAAEMAGAKRLFLEVGHQNAAAVALYQGLGFQQVGLRQAYYAHASQQRQDALVLALALSPCGP
jgi:[ribosomal protein S18]-alanine N-acetyltransferase